MDLRLRTRIAEGLIFIDVGGELELHNAPQLRSELSRASESPAPRIMVDLSGLIFIDSTGIGVIVGGLKKARENGGSMVLVCPTPRIRRVFEITGLLRALPIFETRKEAETSLKAASQIENPSPGLSPVHAASNGADIHNTPFNGTASIEAAPHEKGRDND